MPRALGIDAARVASWHGRRRSGRKKRSNLMLAFQGRSSTASSNDAKRVSPTCLKIHLDRNRYSVPASFLANRPVSVRVYPERIVVAAEGQIISANTSRKSLPTSSPNARVRPPVFDWRRTILAVIQRKPGALRERCALRRAAGLAFRALQQRMLKTPGGDRRDGRDPRPGSAFQHGRAGRALHCRRTGSGGRRAGEDPYPELCCTAWLDGKPMDTRLLITARRRL